MSKPQTTGATCEPKSIPEDLAWLVRTLTRSQAPRFEVERDAQTAIKELCRIFGIPPSLLFQGLYTPNDFRRREGLSPIDGGDEPFTSQLPGVSR